MRVSRLVMFMFAMVIAAAVGIALPSGAGAQQKAPAQIMKQKVQKGPMDKKMRTRPKVTRKNAKGAPAAKAKGKRKGRGKAKGRAAKAEGAASAQQAAAQQAPETAEPTGALAKISPEMRVHLKRVVELKRVEELAKENNNQALLEKVAKLRAMEIARFKKVMTEKDTAAEQQEAE